MVGPIAVMQIKRLNSRHGVPKSLALPARACGEVCSTAWALDRGQASGALARASHARVSSSSNGDSSVRTRA